MHNRIFLGLLALATFLPLPLATGIAHAQGYSAAAAAPRIDGFDVQPVRQATPGTGPMLRSSGAACLSCGEPVALTP